MSINEIIDNGGATLNRAGRAITYKGGYQVSVCDLLTMPVDKLSWSVVESELQKLVKGEHLGLWIDKGLCYIDKSRRIATKKEAMRIGKENKQLSVLRWRDMECLAV